MYKIDNSPRRSFYFLKIILTSLILVSCSITPPEKAEFTPPWNGFTSTKPPQVNGVYIITEAEHLAWLGLVTIINAKVRFDANIDMNNKNFSGIKHFKGTMDGNGYSIKNLKINAPTTDVVGLIHLLTGDNSEIKNLTIENGSIKGKLDVGAFVGQSRDSITLTGLTNKASVETLENSAAGIIAYVTGVIANTIKIKDVKNFGAVKQTSGGTPGTGAAGGIVGYLTIDMSIENAQNVGDIIGTGTGHAGGITGEVASTTDTTFKKVQNLGNITSSSTGSAGGIIALADGLTTKIENAKNKGVIIGLSDTGGIIGFAKGTGAITIEDVQNNRAITTTGTTVNAGGIVGYSERTITINNAQNSGDISATEDGGGIIGQAKLRTVRINNARNSGKVSAKNTTGGIVGYTDTATEIEKVQNSGDISGVAAGGIVGSTQTSSVKIKNAGNYGAITGTSAIGGIVGIINNALNIEFAYNYKSTRIVGNIIGGTATIANINNLNGAPSEVGSISGSVAELSVEQFKEQSSFLGWDFDNIWETGDNHPVLK